MKIDIVDTSGKTTDSVELPPALFDVEPNIPLMHQVVIGQLAAVRQGTHSTKTRGEVRGGGKKPWRQKGTGRARQGSIRSPQWAGGGIVFGPKPRSYDQRTPKKMKAAALRCALSDRARHDRIFAVEKFIDTDKPSTKTARKFLESLTTHKKVLIVVESFDSSDVLSLRNLPQVKILTWDYLNTYDVLDADDVVFTKGALLAFIDARTPGSAKTVEAPSENKKAEDAPDTDDSSKEDSK